MEWSFSLEFFSSKVFLFSPFYRDYWNANVLFASHTSTMLLDEIHGIVCGKIVLFHLVENSHTVFHTNGKGSLLNDTYSSCSILFVENCTIPFGGKFLLVFPYKWKWLK